MEILYKVHNSIYVNLTNKCPCACTFCLRKTMNHVGESSNLWLEREPSAEEVINEFKKWDVESFDEVVFCGFGEPTEAFDVLIKTAEFIKNTYDISIRINTNGLGNLVQGKDIVPMMKGLIDSVSISLNDPDPEEYNNLVRSKFGEKSFDAMISFAKECTKVIPKVIMTTVSTTISKEDEEKCQKICDEIGAVYRIRPYED
ncbi:MAG: TIGR04100 family radical SAM protein [Clostridium sp.]